MQFFVVLLIAFGVGWVLPPRLGGRSVTDAMRRAMAVALLFTGASHLAMPDAFRVYFPGWVPFADALVYATGAVEVVGGLALFGRRHRARVGLAVAAYFVLVFPANVYVAVAGGEASLPGLLDGAWYPWVRLPFQALFVWWALRSTQPPAPAGRPRRALRLLRAAR
jgi:uncharacterized membrane protein